MAKRKGKTTGTSSGIPSSYLPTAPTTTGTGIPGAISAPVFPTNPYVSPVIPLDPAVENARVVGNRNVALSNAYGTYQLGELENVYGLGNDTSNPYSKAKLLEDSYNRSRRGSLNSYAEVGQLHSGAYGRAQGENQRNYLMGYDQLSRSYTGAKQNIGLAGLQTYANAGTSIDQATFDAALRALFPTR